MKGKRSLIELFGFAIYMRNNGEIELKLSDGTLWEAQTAH